MGIAYRSPLSILHLLKSRVIVVGIGCLDCFFAYRRMVKTGNKPRGVLWVCTEKYAVDTDVPVIDSKLAEGMETLGRGERQAYCGSVACIPLAAHSAVLSSSISGVYDTMLFP